MDLVIKSYGKEAFTDLKFMDYYMKAKVTGDWNDHIGFLNNIPDDFDFEKNRIFKL